MFSVIRRCLIAHSAVNGVPRINGGLPCPVYLQVATMKNFEPINTFDDVKIPPKPKLKFLNKVPKKTRYRKVFKSLHDIRGPAEVSNKLMYNQYGLLATTPGYMKHGHFEMIRLTINRFIGDSDRMFARWRVNAPFKPITKKGQGQRMGGGKGSVHHYVTPVKAGRIIMEMGGKMEFEEVHSILYQISKKLPFRCKVISKEIMERDASLYQFRKEENINPWTFERIAKENYLGISKYLGPCDYKWYGEHRVYRKNEQKAEIEQYNWELKEQSRQNMIGFDWLPENNGKLGLLLAGFLVTGAPLELLLSAQNRVSELNVCGFEHVQMYKLNHEP